MREMEKDNYILSGVQIVIQKVQEGKNTSLPQPLNTTVEAAVPSYVELN
jgi:hypothetical protein